MEPKFSHDYAKEVSDILNSSMKDRDRLCKIMSLMVSAVNDGASNSYNLLRRCRDLMFDPQPGFAMWNEAKNDLMLDIDRFLQD